MYYNDKSSSSSYQQFSAAIDNRPISIKNKLQYPSIQNNYPKQIQNNNYNFNTNPNIRKKSITSSLPPALPSIISPAQSPASINSISNHHIARQNHQNENSNEQVIVKIIPSNGWYLNDAEERKSYFQAVANGLLNENGNVYVNNIQKSQNRRNNFEPHAVTEPSESTDLAEDIYFTGPSSYQLPLSSVGKLACDSDSVSSTNNFGIRQTIGDGVDDGYRYDPPCRKVV